MIIQKGDIHKTTWVNDEVYDYVLTTGNRISEVKHKLVAETIEKFPDTSTMLSTQDQSQLMKTLVQLTGAKRGIEVGTYTGYSALNLAEGLPSDGKLICLDVSDEFTSLGKKYWKEAGVDDRIELILGPGVDTLDSMIAEEDKLNSFDFAYVDADKPNYKLYYERLLQLMKPNGFIMFDNMLWRGKVCEPYQEGETEQTTALRELNDYLQADDRIDLCMIPIADGLTIARKK